MEEEKRHEDNVYAATIENVVIHISQAESGRRGYYCLGCNGILQAKRSNKIKEHFAHDPQNKKLNKQCTYSDETYRHKLAKEILQRIMQIKAPAVYKYPPKGIDGRANKLRDAEFIEAERVSIELTFFEDEEGVIRYGRNVDFEKERDKYLLIRPDVTFFDGDDNPILFIEIVATHKVDVEKITKLRRLGINTVQVTIPKDSPEAIENTFYYTDRTKWIYNNEHEKATYIPTPQRDGQDLSSADDIQRKLFQTAESYECRAAQINDLIRGINKSLASEQYRDAEQYLRREIQRVEDNTEGNRGRLRILQEEHERRIKEEFSAEIRDVERQEKEVGAESRKLDEETGDYETRYSRKRKELEQAQSGYRSEFDGEIEEIERDFERLGTDAVNFGKRSEEIRGEEEFLEQRYRNQVGDIENQTRATTEGIAEIDRRRSGLSEKYVEVEAGIRSDFDGKRKEIEEQFTRDCARVRREFEVNGRDSIKAIEARDSQRVSRVEGRLRGILETRERLKNCRERKIAFSRLQKFRELFASGAYKSWA